MSKTIWTIYFKILFSSIFLLFTTNVYTQKEISKEEKEGNELIGIAYGFYNTNQLDSAEVYCLKAAEKYKEAKNWGYYIHVLTDLSRIYYEEKNFKEFNTVTIKSYDESLVHLDSNNIVRAKVFNNMHIYYYSLGNYEQSIEKSKESLRINERNKADKAEIVNNYISLGNSFKFLGDFENAFSYLRKALDTQIANNVPSSNIAETYRDIGIVFNLNNQIDSAILYYEKAEQIYLPVKTDNILINRKVDNALSLAELWNKKSNQKLAKRYIAKAVFLPLNNFYKIKSEEILAKVYLSEQNFKEAILALNRGNQLANKSNKRNTPPLLARRYILLAKAYNALDNTPKTLESYQLGLQALSPDFVPKDLYDNPKSNQLLDKIDALTLLNNKARFLHETFSKTKERVYLEASNNTYESASNLIKEFRQGILNIESKKSLSEKTTEVYDGAIQVAIKLFELTKEQSYLESALALAETNKAQLLLERLNEQTAKNFASIPDSLLEQEKNIKLKIAYLEKGVLENNSNNKVSKDDLFDLKQQLENFTIALEKEYPRYYNLKYKNASSSLREIQEHLKNSNKAFLEYFVGEKHIYLFTITKDHLNVEQIENQTLVRQNIETLRNIINNPPSDKFNLDDYNQFTTIANTLYNQLIKPSLDQLSTEINDIVIIPDYYLNYIPFDILLKDKKLNLGNLSPEVLEYLFEDYNLSYDYSITLHLKNQNREGRKFENDFIGFAPEFKSVKEVVSRTCSEDELYALQCSEREVANIADLTDGVPMIGEAANRASFEAKIQGNRIIHLATHACIDEQNSNLNKIFLTDDYLSDFDLYNMELNAELAVLSACNTGSGKLIKGEGVMSLARGFINAGCSSTLISMWSVDDCATSDIMTYFYEGLIDGNTKDEALKKAKLKYLNTVDKSKMHPYYWAAFVPFGDMKVIELKQSFHWSFYLLFIILPLLLYFFFKK